MEEMYTTAENNIVVETRQKKKKAWRHEIAPSTWLTDSLKLWMKVSTWVVCPRPRPHSETLPCRKTNAHAHKFWNQTAPWVIIALPTLRKPAIVHPWSRFPWRLNSLAIDAATSYTSSICEMRDSGGGGYNLTLLPLSLVYALQHLCASISSDTRTLYDVGTPYIPDQEWNILLERKVGFWACTYVTVFCVLLLRKNQRWASTQPQL